MANEYRAPRGTYDVVPPRSATWLAVREALIEPIRRSGYSYIETPVFEDTGLFVRGVGESTDVVRKEMYTFSSKGGQSLTLRPESTAPVLRAIIERNLTQNELPIKLWYAQTHFRYEAPQAGRYRQHTSVGLEAVGSGDPRLDAEVIWVATEGLRNVGLLEQVEVKLNSLGCVECRPSYRALLQDFLRALDLDDDTRARVELNPMRVLDDKRPDVQEKLAGAPLITDHLCAACKEHYDAVRSLLTDLGIRYVDSPRLVRGLDYYVRTTFEFSYTKLGAQDALGGGGRYDELLESIGGPALPGIGFGLGLDRIVLAAEAEGTVVADPTRVDVFVVPLGETARRRTVTLLADLRRDGVAADTAYAGQGLKGAMRAADRSGARHAIIFGDRDLAAGAAQLKDLRTGDQEPVPLDRVVATVKERLQ